MKMKKLLAVLSSTALCAAMLGSCGNSDSSSKGGAEAAVKMLNTNLDMDIENFVTVSYWALVGVIDAVGGVNIDVDTHPLREDGSIIEGLYCAGEITGNFHGANRLGGNAIVDFCVFGRIAGANAAAGK